MTANFDDHVYRREEMPNTDGGRRLRKIDGEPSAISTRATEIADLGDKMARAARTLELFADGTVGKGESFDAIREQAKEVHADLSVAAQRYRPSGAALGRYAAALSTAQGATGWRVDGANNAWPDVNAAAWALNTAQSEQDDYDRAAANDDEEPTGTRPSTGAEEGALAQAVATWDLYWSGYDAPVETWESAYDTAVDSLEGANADGVKDSFWDNSMPFMEAMLTVLFVVGIVLIVVAFVVTGPLALIAGVLATVAGVLSLLGEIAKLNAGRGDWTSVALAAVGIIPFGKLAKLGQLADFAQVGATFPRISGAFRLAGDEFIQYGRALDSFVGSKIPGLFSRTNDFGEIVYRSPHGLNSQNMFRGLLTPSFLAQGNALVGSWAGGWRALAGNPTNAAEALGGAVDVYVDLVSTLREAGQRLQPAQ